MVNESKLSLLRNELVEQLKLNFNSKSNNVVINIIEIANNEINAEILADLAKQQIQKRIPFRRVIRNIILKAKKEYIKGIKIQISGRLNGAEIARTEWSREGRVPLHTLTANIDYSICRALLSLKLI